MYAKIIMIANQKGGKGKTLHSHLFALNLSSKKHNYKVLILEFDPQQTLSKLIQELKNKDKELNPLYDIETASFKKIKETVGKYIKKYDYILIDIPGMLELEGIRTAMSITHTVFVPLKPSVYNSTSTYEFIEECIELKEERYNSEYPFQYYIFMNGNSQTNRKYAREEKEKLNKIGIPILKNETPERKRYFDEETNFTEAMLDIEKPSAHEYDYIKLFNEMLDKIK